MSPGASQMIREASPFSISVEEFHAALSEAGAFVAREFCNPTPRPIMPSVPQRLFDELISSKPPGAGQSLRSISTQAQRFLAKHTARIVPAGFSAMVTTSPNPYAVLADILACAFNQHLARADVCEFGARLEERVIRWIGEFIGYPTESGTLTMGGASANLIALAAARSTILGKEVRRRGLKGAPLVAYASTETHVSTERAIEVLGIGSDNLKRIRVDPRFRMNVHELQKAIEADRAAGLMPFAVIAQGGSVATGAVDPMNEIASICERYNLWMHVDAAYGGPAAAVAPASQEFAGLSRADSVTIDPHKWLYINFDCGCLLVKKARILESALGAESATYLRGDVQIDAPDFMSRGIDFSRGLRALKVWATFVGLGVDALKLAIDQDMRLASKFGELIEQSDQFELCTRPSLSIVVFRFIPESGLDEDYLDALNARIPSALRKDGRIYLGSNRLAGATVLRVCLINHRVTDNDLVEWVDIVTKIGNAVHSERAQWWYKPR